jgi:hypothetical protein
MSVNTTTTKRPTSTVRREPILAQGIIEKAFPTEEPCTERVRFMKATGWQSTPENLFAMKRGIIAGELVERQLVSYSAGHGFDVDLGAQFDAFIQSRPLDPAITDRLAELRTSTIQMVRGWQSRFPMADDDLEWSEVDHLLQPQTDLFVRRPEKFAIRIRPDVVVGVGDTLLALEFTTAKDPQSLSPARTALNHWALLRERLRRPEWARFQNVGTRIERLALESGTTVYLGTEDAEGWRVKLGEVAENLVSWTYDKNRGPWCSTCNWQAPCWFGDEGTSADSF